MYWTLLIPWWVWIIIGIATIFESIKWSLKNDDELLLRPRFFLVGSLVSLSILVILSNIVRGTGFLLDYAALIDSCVIPSLLFFLIMIIIYGYFFTKSSKTNPIKAKAVIISFVAILIAAAMMLFVVMQSS